MTDEMPTVISEGELRIAPDLTIKVLVLSNGMRIIPVEDMQRVCEWLGVDAGEPDIFFQPAKQGEGQ